MNIAFGHDIIPTWPPFSASTTPLAVGRGEPPDSEVARLELFPRINEKHPVVTHAAIKPLVVQTDGRRTFSPGVCAK